MGDLQLIMAGGRMHTRLAGVPITAGLHVTLILMQCKGRTAPCLLEAEALHTTARPPLITNLSSCTSLATCMVL
jgi:hypothetical protein